MLAQQNPPESSADVAYWVAYWVQPRVVLFGPEERAFNQNLREIMFPWNDHDEPSNLGTLDDNVRWLKDLPSDRFYIDGYFVVDIDGDGSACNSQGAAATL